VTASDPGTFTAELPAQADPAIGQELIRIRHDDGRVEEVHLHDYARLYALPGVYEQIVTDRLSCRSPWQIAGMLAATVDRIGWRRSSTRVIDLAAGNGVSGEALASEGLGPVLGTDIVPVAREACLRDRPDVYAHYLTLDLLELTDEQRSAIAVLGANAVACVVPVGDGPSQLPPRALAAAVGLLSADALVAYMYDPAQGVPDAVTTGMWAQTLGAGVQAGELERRRYVHRRTVNGEPYEMDGVVWRVVRGAQTGPAVTARDRPQAQ
jgi:hypothetical protein